VSTGPKGSLELVGEFFEVRAQVDHDLTTISRVDRRLGLIKNLGRHSEARNQPQVSAAQHDDHWSFVMLPDIPAVSAPILSSQDLVSRRCGP
jgi:hypothetical protein